jgi:hypothetical protein
MKYLLKEEQYRFLLSEQKVSKEIEGCSVFSDMNKREFCKSVEKEISTNLTEYSAQMEKLLKKYFTSDDRITEVQMEQLNQESEIVKEGFNKIEEVVGLISRNCPQAKQIAEKLKNQWISKYNVYFKDSNGDYHLLNRLDTNYTAMAVLITIFYEELIDQVRTWTSRKTTPSSFFVKDWIDHFFNSKVPLIDPRKGWENDVTQTQKKLAETPNPVAIFNKVFKPQGFEVKDSKFHKDFMKALQQVRDKGFKTEDLFETMLNEKNIVHKRYGYDYSFVDMILGIDFLIQQIRRGSDYWVPVQVKSSFRELYNLVDMFKCTKVIKPELTKIDGKDDFKIGDIRGFEEYFCEEHNYCRTTDKRVYAPSSVDYFGSAEFEK